MEAPQYTTTFVIDNDCRPTFDPFLTKEGISKYDQQEQQRPSTSTFSNVSACDSGYDSGSENSRESSASIVSEDCDATSNDSLASRKLFVLPSSPDQNLTATGESWRVTQIKFLAAERCQIVNYFPTNPNVTPYMRNLVVGWMRDVCYEEMTDAEVFPLSVNYLDRFLARQTILKTQFQGLAAGCLLVASKIKMPIPFSTIKLAAYTDDSVPSGQIMSWELLVLSRLNWDVSSVTAIDFVEPFLQHFIHNDSLASSTSQKSHHFHHQHLRAATVDAIHSLQMDFHFALLSQPDQAAVAVHHAATHLFQLKTDTCQALFSKFPPIQMEIVKYWSHILDVFLQNEESFPSSSPTTDFQKIS